MRLAPGTRLGDFEVVDGLGAGGMGEVYRVRDTVLHREVALKIVHPDYCHHEDSLTRLKREARTLAALNHPNIATLHGLAEFDGSCGLVMELVGGETLADVLRHRSLKFDEVVRLSSQVAAGLEAAHERGVIHRDLKPANIKLTSDGTAKVLDFGLAKAADNRDPLASTIVTSQGIIIGTAPYMSPEQARGAELDRRTDVWSFGCVLFEMLTRRRAFDGETRSDIVAGILDREPDWSLLPATTPQAIRRLLKRCLEKEMRRRVRDIGDVRLELEDALLEPHSVEASSAAAAGPAPVAWAPWLRSAAFVAVGAIAGALAALGSRNTPTNRNAAEIRFSVALPDEERVAATELGTLAMHPDGRSIAYVATRGTSTQLLLRTLDGTATRPLANTSGAVSPFFSPDGAWVAFFADGKLKKIPIAGGAPVAICDAPDGLGGSWGSSNTIVFASSTGAALQRVSADGGAPSRATELDVSRGEFSHRWPDFLPDGVTVLFTVGTVGEWDQAEIVAQSLATGKRTAIVKGGTSPHYVAPGYLAYAHDGAIWIAPFEPGRQAVTGPATRSLEGVATSVDGAVQFAVSGSGTAVYHPSAPASVRRLVVVEGQSQTPLAAAPHSYFSPRVSPDGKKVLLGISDDTEHIWSYDLSAGTLTQITFEGANRSAIWSATGSRVTFASNRNGAFNIFNVPAGAEGVAERVTSGDALQLPGSWSPDGELLAFMEQNSTTGRDVWLLRRDGQRIPFAISAADESSPRFSPDGRRIAYVSNASGQSEVYVRDLGASGPGRKVSVDNGSEPVWRDASSVYFRSYGKLLVASLAGGVPRLVFDGVAEPGTFDAPGYDVLSGASNRFVMLSSATASGASSELRMILNWPPPATSSR